MRVRKERGVNPRLSRNCDGAQFRRAPGFPGRGHWPVFMGWEGGGNGKTRRIAAKTPKSGHFGMRGETWAAGLFMFLPYILGLRGQSCEKINSPTFPA
jgi:hypothetical protein